jgi:hypothetical protein
VKGGRLPLLVFGVVLVVGFLRLGVPPTAALAVCYALPLAGSAVCLSRIVSEGVRGPLAGAAVCAVIVAFGSVLEVHHTVSPGPQQHIELSNASPKAVFDVPSSVSELEVLVHGSLARSPGAEGHANIELERDGRTQTLLADFSRGTVRDPGRGRSAARPARNAHDEERFRVALAGAGPIRATLRSVQGALGSGVTVELGAVPTFIRAVEVVLVLSLLLAVLSEVIASRRARVERFSAWLAGAAVFALYLERSFQRDDPGGSLMPALVVGLLLGAGGALVLGASLRALLSALKPSLRPPASTP